MRLAWVTCCELPEADHDEALALDYLNANGFETTPEPWDGTVAWAQFDAAIIRSCWNYYYDPEAFLGWVDHVASVTRLVNPAPVISWNIDKLYLLELAQKGVPVVPTSHSLNPNWNKFVIKPRVSASSYMTRVFDSTQWDEAGLFMMEVKNPIVQPYMQSVEGEGERSIMWINGEFTHAIRKSPRFSDGEESVSEAYDPTPEEIKLAKLALEAAPAGLSYARIDVMRDDSGTLCISELELIEPSLFLKQNSRALEYLADALRWI